MENINVTRNKPLARSYEEEERLSQYLRATNLKATRPRLLVLSLLQEMEGHYSADDVVQVLRERGTPLPRASVYNALEVLLRQGLVMVGDAGPGRVLYEVSKPWHHHFVCVDCGIVIDIPCLKGEKPCLSPADLPGTVEEAQIIFRGHCQACLLAAQEKNS